ncbi:MAG TPA: hypothetical protein VE090_02600 [Methylomirabilota bacterium]|nr:hypothetical protein [Methylomirabilota bacterium]
MTQAKIQENLEILRLRDEEGRMFTWIKKHLEEQYGRIISVKNITKIYYREKAKIKEK